MNTIHSCGIKINPMTVSEISSITDKWLNEGKKGIQITGINIEQMALLDRDKDFVNYINASDIVNIDGVVVSWYLKLKGFRLYQRTLCADILAMMLQKANDRSQSIYLLGATQDTIEILVDKIKKQYPNIEIKGYHNGYFQNEQEIINDIKSKTPDYLFIGMPSPFKERFITTYKEVLNAGICFGVGGMFDILAGKVKRAPDRVQKMGLEWLYRISQNPIGHTRRVLRAFLPCMKIFMKHMFERQNK